MTSFQREHPIEYEFIKRYQYRTELCQTCYEKIKNGRSIGNKLLRDIRDAIEVAKLTEPKQQGEL